MTMTFHERVEKAVMSIAIKPPGRVHVETRGGDHAILHGMVSSRAELDEIERIVWAVPGVCNVDCNVAVLVPGREEVAAKGRRTS
jgi:osmotically-inducible protein OsmY